MSGTCVGNINLVKMLADTVASCGGSKVIVFEDAEGHIADFSYDQFQRLVNKTANGLLKLGIKKGSKVAIHLPNCPEWLQSFFAIMKIGAICVPLNTLLVAPELEYQIEHSETIAVITQMSFADIHREIKTKHSGLKHIIIARHQKPSAGVILLNELVERLPDKSPTIEINVDDDAVVLYTSGTTARPKGVVWTHENIVYSAIVNALHQRLTAVDRHMLSMPLFHANGLCVSAMASVLVGASIIVLERFSASQYMDQVRKHKGTVASLAGTAIRVILAQAESEQDCDHRLRICLFAGLSEQERVSFEQRFKVPMINLWGMTENMATGTRSPLYGNRKPESVGLPTLGCVIRIVDEYGNELAPKNVGEIITQGHSMIKGYLKDKDATQQAIKDGWLHTGDLAFADDDGYIYFVDRKKDVIKRAGENIAPAEVESAINEHPKVIESAVIGIPDPFRDQAVKAFIVLKSGENITPEEIVDFCSKRLAKFKVPQYVEFVDSLPKTPVGKIQKHLLKT